MDSLIEVDLDLILECAEKFEKIQIEGKKVIARLKAQKVKKKSWIFFKKEVSVWSYLHNDTSFFGPAYWAEKLGYVMAVEGRYLRIAGWSKPDFFSYPAYGVRVLLSQREYENLHYIMETDIEEEGDHPL